MGARTDLPLTPIGHKQAVALGAHFKQLGVAPSLILTGPLERTVATALAIAETASYLAPLQIDDRLKEIDYGPDENKEESFVTERVGAESLNLWEKEGVPALGWIASPEALFSQWETIGHEIIQQYPGRDVIAVTSNGIARFSCALFGGLEVLKMQGGLKLRTGAYGLITHTPETGWELQEWDLRPEKK